MARGNFDCPQGRSCDDGECVRGGEGPVGTFGECEGDSDCSGDLCINGVCTRPCDIGDGCPALYFCEQGTVPGGLCIPESCRDKEDSCAEDFACVYSSASRYVCAKGVAANACGCDATGTSTPSAPLAGMLLVGSLDLLRRRRRGHVVQQAR